MALTLGSTSCGPLLDAFGDNVDGEEATVENRAEQQIWLGSERTDIGASFITIEPAGGQRACVRGAGTIFVFTKNPEVSTEIEPAFQFALDDEDFCSGTYIWNGTELDLKD